MGKQENKSWEMVIWFIETCRC